MSDTTTATTATASPSWDWNLSRLWTKFTRLFPRLVWYGQELDVLITFKADKLRPIIEKDEKWPLSEERQQELEAAAKLVVKDSPIEEAQALLRRSGLSFDTGIGTEGRDWFFDYSLSGPISVTFRGVSHTEWKRKEA